MTRRCTESQRYRDLRRFLLCIVFYQAGITAVVSLAAIYAEQAMKFSMQQTITLILVVNVTAAVGAFGFGYVQDAIGHVRAVAHHAGGMDRDGCARGNRRRRCPASGSRRTSPDCAWALRRPRAAPSSAISRRPRASRNSSACGASRSRRRRIFGPLTYGAVTWLFAGNHRLAIFATGVYFVVGLALLAGIDVERGRRQALAA